MRGSLQPGFLACALASGIAAAGSPASVGTAFVYQGELRDAGQPASGLYDVQACLHDTADGGAALNCLPGFEDVVVDAGRFTLNLDFGTAFDGEARYLAFAVRPGASSGAFVPLAPRQPIRATPEALHAASAPWNGITGAPPGLADGIDDVGITSLAAGAGLTTTPGGGTSSGSPITTVGTLSVRTGGITSALIADGAVGAAQIDPDQVQRRVATVCAEGQYLRGIGADGGAICAAISRPIDRNLGQRTSYGQGRLSLDLTADDRPVLALEEPVTDTHYLHICSDADCSAALTRVLATGSIDRGDLAVIVRSDGRPLVARGNLGFYDCVDADCTSWTTVPAQAGGARTISAARRPDGRAVFSYVNPALRLYSCADTACSSGSSVNVANSVENPLDADVAVRADGRPILSYSAGGSGNSRLRMRSCVDEACSSTTSRDLDATPDTGSSTSIAIRSADRAVISYYDTSEAQIRSYDCANANCTSGAITSFTGGNGVVSAVAVAPGDITLIAFRSPAGLLTLRDCIDSACAASMQRTLYPGAPAGNAVEMRVRSDGRPVVAHRNELGQPMLHICANPRCT